MVTHNFTELKSKAQMDFIAARTKEEQIHDNWLASLLKCAKEKVLSKIPFDVEHFTFREAWPEAFADEINVEVYKQQFEELNRKKQLVNQIIYEMNADAEKLLAEYQALS